jgi:hypothetical protein
LQQQVHKLQQDKAQQGQSTQFPMFPPPFQSGGAGQRPYSS